MEEHSVYKPITVAWARTGRPNYVIFTLLAPLRCCWHIHMNASCWPTSQFYSTYVKVIQDVRDSPCSGGASDSDFAAYVHFKWRRYISSV